MWGSPIGMGFFFAGLGVLLLGASNFNNSKEQITPSSVGAEGVLNRFFGAGRIRSRRVTFSDFGRRIT
jgi:hypothetical protein